MRKSPKIGKRVVRYFIFKHHKIILDFSHFDVNTIHFLGLIGSLLTADLKLNLQCTSNSRWKCEENLRTILTNLAPLLLDGVHSLSFSAGHVGYKADWTFPMVKQFFGEQLANVKKVLEIHGSGIFPFLTKSKENFALSPDYEFSQENVNTIMNWLISGNGPKLLKVFFPDFDARFPAQIFAAIRAVGNLFAICILFFPQLTFD